MKCQVVPSRSGQKKWPYLYDSGRVGSGTSVRRNFLSGAGINSSFAVEQDATGRAQERCLAVGIGIGSGLSLLRVFDDGFNLPLSMFPSIGA